MLWLFLIAIACSTDPSKGLPDSGMSRKDAACTVSTTRSTESTQGPPSFVAAPILERAERIGLARTLRVALDVPASLVVALDDGEEPRTLRFRDTGTDHAVPILGLSADTPYTLTVTTEPPGPEASLTFTTDPLPPDFPLLEVLHHDPVRIEPGVTLITPKSSADPGYLIILDERLRPVWYHRAAPAGFTDVRRGPDGAFWGTSGGSVARVALDRGETAAWHTVSGRPDAVALDLENLHHSVVPQPDGSFWTLTWDSVEVADHPTSYRPGAPGARQRISDGAVVHVQPDGTVTRKIVLRDVLDRTRLAWDCLDPNNALGADWAHPNALEIDSDRRTLLVTLRHQDAVVSIDLDTEEPLWILSNPSGWSPDLSPLVLTLAADTTGPFHPHAARMTSANELLLFDNRNVINTPYDSATREVGAFSRVVAYELDLATRTATQAWSYDNPPGGPLFVHTMGDADKLPTTGNILSTWANLSVEDGVANPSTGRGDRSARVIEFSPEAPDPPALDVRVYSDRSQQRRGWHIYRSERLPALYPEGMLF